MGARKSFGQFACESVANPRNLTGRRRRCNGAAGSPRRPRELSPAPSQVRQKKSLTEDRGHRVGSSSVTSVTAVSAKAEPSAYGVFADPVSALARPGGGREGSVAER